MRNLFNKLRNLLTVTAGVPVAEPEMVTKELPSGQSVTDTEEREKTSWKDTVSILVTTSVDGVIMFFTYMWKLIPYV